MIKTPTNDVFLSSIFSTIRESISINDNNEKTSDIKRTYLRLIKQNINEDEIIDAIASVVICEMYFALKCKEYDLFKERFHENLDNLPRLPILN